MTVAGVLVWTVDDDDDDDDDDEDDVISVTSVLVASTDSDVTTVVSANVTTCRAHCSSASRARDARRQRMSERRDERG